MSIVSVLGIDAKYIGEHLNAYVVSPTQLYIDPMFQGSNIGFYVNLLNVLDHIVGNYHF